MIILIAVIALCIPITAPRLFGFQMYTVISGSMEPSIPVGSLIYTRAEAPENIVEDDVIAFYSGTDAGAIITHRVVSNMVVSGQFITKGDANDVEDLKPIPYSDLVGKVELHIPYIGGILSAVTTTYGKIAIACLIGFAVLLQLIGGAMKRD